jgi:NADPH-dependent curcumin reductase CurA
VKDKIPIPSQGEVLVQNLYLSLDPAMKGWMTDKKSYVSPVKLGEVMRGSAIGLVLESKSDKFAAGDYVFGMLGWQQFALLNENGRKLHRIPGVPLTVWLGPLGGTGLTAYFGLLDIGKPQPGETVVVSGAAGGVGQIVGQIAKIKGCRTVGIAGSDEKCDLLLKKYGYDAAINYKTSNNILADLSKCCPKGIDIYFDNVGGSILDAALVKLNKRARVVVCGAISQYDNLSNPQGPKNYLQLLVTSSKMEGFVVTDFINQWDQAVAEMIEWIKTGKLKYTEHIVNGLEKAPASLPMLFTGENEGKLIIKISDDPKSKL